MLYRRVTLGDNSYLVGAPTEALLYEAERSIRESHSLRSDLERESALAVLPESLQAYRESFQYPVVYLLMYRQGDTDSVIPIGAYLTRATADKALDKAKATCRAVKAHREAGSTGPHPPCIDGDPWAKEDDLFLDAVRLRDTPSFDFKEDYLTVT